MSEPLLEIDHVSHTFGSRRSLLPGRRPLLAVDDVSLTVRAGESVALVGESGSGKTTLGRTAAGLISPTEGRLLVEGEDLATLRGQRVQAYRRTVQMIFQNTQHGFNPRRRVRDILADPFEIHRLPVPNGLDAALGELMERVGLRASMLDRYPHQFSGGQRQRIGIARALSLQPRLIIADEPVSALDVSVQAQILNLFAELREELGLSLLFVSHDLRAVYFLCERIAVLYQGRLVEIASREQLLENPRHPYSRSLIAAVPGRAAEAGNPAKVPAGPAAGDPSTPTSEQLLLTPSSNRCNFVAACPLYEALGRPERCLNERPLLISDSTGSGVACHFSEIVTAAPNDSHEHEHRETSAVGDAR
jgi:peptide/nickel transport system ATP-binding protein